MTARLRSRPFFERLAEPPRRVPPGVRIHAVLGGAGLFGWIMLALASFFGWTLVGNADAWSPLVFKAVGASLAQGVVTSAREIRASRGATVREVSYRFTGPDGQERSGRSYVTWPSPAPAAGERVTVEFPAGTPSVSRIQGMRRSRLEPYVVLIVLVFPAVALAIVVFTARSGLRLSRLLAHGRLNYGRLEIGEPGEPAESATLVDGLPKAIQATEDGGFRVEGVSAVVLLVLPLLTILGNAFAAYFLLLR